ncbi:hypothetical protein QKT49_gp046 [Acanthamoeba castellanii medusavirus]|uniref:Uncharacterized protein n=1 Tax=Acanthamoeba castellanii medusavirus J1 TaxID=3114988 RepID=A0A3T1CWI2_9VIRU|nr:hypothetical protein QKT49_gp046 [Acanthamoeba castellanii medusavirus]BBI30186.1 hypothetical protein [Acanthamoeba castellanii medusavirus J1]
MQHNRVCDKCERLFTTSQARGAHRKFCGGSTPAAVLPERGLGELCREIEPIMKIMIAIEKRGLKRRAPEEMDMAAVVDMVNAKNCLTQLSASIEALMNHVQETVDASREFIAECQRRQEESIEALYIHRAPKKAKGDE